MINLNKLDSNLIKIVVDRTSKTTVHKKEDAFVEKDGRHRHDKQDLEDLRKKIRIINRVFRENEIAMVLTLESEEEESIIRILVTEIESGRLLARLEEEDLDRILEDIHVITGIIFDKKG